MDTQEKFHTGAIPDKYDARDLHWGHEIGMMGEPFDWEKGFDIEAEVADAIGDADFRLPVNDQNGSSSCGGQASSKKGEVISALHNKTFKRKSAKFPYAQVFVAPGGSRGRDLCGIAARQGFGDETDTLSYENGKPPTEPFMQRKSDITAEAIKNAGADKAFAYADVSMNIDAVARAIRDTKGVILGIYGTNNLTWRSKFPLPAKDSALYDDVWAHWVYAGKAKMINGKKYIGFINSWNDKCGDKGWQWVTEDYFKARWGLFNIWTMIYNVWGQTTLFDRVLRYRNKGEDVYELQKRLRIPADGVFGPVTLRAVKNFQFEQKLVMDGIVGPKTQEALLAFTTF